MILTSAVLVLIAFVTLIAGIFQGGLALIGVSIGASVLSAVFLGLGVVGSRQKGTATAPEATPFGATPAEASAAGDGAARGTTSPTLALPVEESEPEAQAPASARKRAAPPQAQVTPAPKKAESPEAQETVVVIPDRDRYHRESCRYARSPGAMTLSKGQARRRGYKQCGVCKP